MRKYLKPAVTQREEKENEKEEKSHLQPPTRFFEPVGFETSNYVRSVERALRLGEDIPTILASSVPMYPCGTADAAAFRCNGTRAQSNTPRLQCVFAPGKLDHPTDPPWTVQSASMDPILRGGSSGQTEPSCDARTRDPRNLCNIHDGRETSPAQGPTWTHQTTDRLLVPSPFGFIGQPVNWSGFAKLTRENAREMVGTHPVGPYEVLRTDL
jgi:hypothetical protein